jgi:hypothetical protein
MTTEPHSRNYGKTTEEFLIFLRDNGPQTIDQLIAAKIFSRVKSRIPVLIKQNRIERVDVINHKSGYKVPSVITAYKYIEGASITSVRKIAHKPGEIK